jgi:hypothetical protein
VVRVVVECCRIVMVRVVVAGLAHAAVMPPKVVASTASSSVHTSRSRFNIVILLCNSIQATHGSVGLNCRYHTMGLRAKNVPTDAYVRPE